MPTGNSSGKSAQQYPKLKRKIEQAIDLGVVGLRKTLGSHIKSKYPELYLKIRRDRTGIDLLRLYREVGLPTEGTCAVCGEKTGIPRWSMKPKELCSRVCFSLGQRLFNERRRRTSLANYGVEHPCKSEEVRLCQKNTLKLRTGYESPMQNPRTKLKASETYRFKTGYKNPLQNPEVRLLMQSNYKVKTGYDHPLHNPAVMEKFLRSSLQVKNFTSKKGKNISYQGYEGRVLVFLESHPLVKEITTSTDRKTFPSIPYNLNGRPRVYYPDIGVELKDGRRLVIEVKSEYTLEGSEVIKKVNRAKFRAASRKCKALGLAFWLAVYRGKELQWIKDGEF